MSISFSCPSCNKILRGKNEQAGRTLKCPSCQSGVTVVPAQPILPSKAGVPPFKSSFKRFGEALKKGSVEDVKYFVEKKGANIKAKDKHGSTILHFAVGNDSVDVLKYLISRGADVNEKDNDGRTPIFVAAYNGNVSAMQCLKDNGADVKINDNNNRSLVSWAKFGNRDGAIAWLYANGAVSEQPNSPVAVTLEGGSQNIAVTINASTVTLLWGVFAFLCLLAFTGFMTWIVLTWVALPAAVVTLILAIKEPNRIKGSTLKEIIKNDPNNVEALFELGVWYKNYRDLDSAKQCLEKAVTLSHMEARDVLDQCVDVEKWEKYQSNFTNIFDASTKGTLEDVRYFVEKKSRLDCLRPILRFIENTRQTLERKKQFEWGQQLLHFAEDVWYFVEKRCAHVNAKDKNGDSLLHNAAQHNSVDVVQYLISKGANVNAKDYNSKTPLDFANTEEKKRILREAGGKPGPVLPPASQPSAPVPPIRTAPTSLPTDLPFETQPAVNSGAKPFQPVLYESAPLPPRQRDSRPADGAMGCYHHPSQQAVAQCRKCGKGICRDCFNVYGVVSGEYAGKALCYDCAAALVEKNIKEVKKLKKGTQFLGLISKSVSIVWKAFSTTWKGTQMCGSGNPGGGWADGPILAIWGMFVLFPLSPIRIIWMIISLFRQITRAKAIIAHDSRVLQKWRDYFAYQQAKEQNEGVDMANWYAREVQSLGEQAAQEELRRGIAQIIENHETLKRYNNL